MHRAVTVGDTVTVLRDLGTPGFGYTAKAGDIGVVERRHNGRLEVHMKQGGVFVIDEGVAELHHTEEDEANIKTAYDALMCIYGDEVRGPTKDGWYCASIGVETDDGPVTVVLRFVLEPPYPSDTPPPVRLEPHPTEGGVACSHPVLCHRLKFGLREALLDSWAATNTVYDIIEWIRQAIPDYVKQVKSPLGKSGKDTSPGRRTPTPPPTTSDSPPLVLKHSSPVVPILDSEMLKCQKTKFVVRGAIISTSEEAASVLRKLGADNTATGANSEPCYAFRVAGTSLLEDRSDTEGQLSQCLLSWLRLAQARTHILWISYWSNATSIALRPVYSVIKDLALGVLKRLGVEVKSLRPVGHRRHTPIKTVNPLKVSGDVELLEEWGVLWDKLRSYADTTELAVCLRKNQAMSKGVLDMSGLNLGDEGLAAVASWLCSTPTVAERTTVIDITGNQGGKAMGRFAMVIERWRKVEGVSLGRNHAAGWEHGVLALVKALQGSPSGGWVSIGSVRNARARALAGVLRDSLDFVLDDYDRGMVEIHYNHTTHNELDTDHLWVDLGVTFVPEGTADGRICIPPVPQDCLDVVEVTVEGSQVKDRGTRQGINSYLEGGATTMEHVILNHCAWTDMVRSVLLNPNIVRLGVKSPSFAWQDLPPDDLASTRLRILELEVGKPPITSKQLTSLRGLPDTVDFVFHTTATKGELASSLFRTVGNLRRAMRGAGHTVLLSAVDGAFVVLAPPWSDPVWDEGIESFLQSIGPEASSFTLEATDQPTLLSASDTSARDRDISAAEVSDLLGSYGVPLTLRGLFVEQDIDGAALRLLDEQTLEEEFGVDDPDIRLLILQCISRYKSLVDDSSSVPC